MLAFIGIGNVGFTIANQLQQAGHQILVAHDNPNSDSVQAALSKNSAFQVDGLSSAIAQADLIFLATPFKVCADLLSGLSFDNKVLVDCTNPVGPGLTHALGSTSGAEKIQEWAPDARVVKAYSTYGYENFDGRWRTAELQPTMLIAGDDEAAKQQLIEINTSLGFATLDTGSLTQALQLEHMALLWIKMVRAGKRPNFVWAAIND